MFDAKTCISKLFDYLSNLPTNAALKEHVAIIKERLYDIQNEVEKLKKENEKLKRENEILRSDLSILKSQKQFIDLGCCFITTNELNWTVLCPICHNVLSREGVNYYCKPCQYKIDVKSVHFSVQRYFHKRKNLSQKK